MTISIKEKFRDDIQKLYLEERFKNISVMNRGFMSSEKITTDGILFVGLNPSFVDNTPTNSVSFYDVEISKEEYKRYFGKFADVAKKTNLPWAHIDLLFLRETNQNLIDEIMQEQNGVDFIYEQLMISKQILEVAKPRVIVVCNTKARQFLGRDKTNELNVWMGHDFVSDEAIGTDRVCTPWSGLKGVPVFFTSMLTGQRALDKGSYDRLIWHIKFVLN